MHAESFTQLDQRRPRLLLDQLRQPRSIFGVLPAQEEEGSALDAERGQGI
jgi:hypothetical protein